MPAAGASARSDDEPFERCQDALNYTFQDGALLRAALTHASGANHRLASNERLEFLGDAILGAVVCAVLFERFPESQEGELTRIKSQVVSRRTCAKISQALGLDQYMILGKGMGTLPRAPHSVLSDVFESLVGAIYLDGGMEAARAFVTAHILPEIEAAVSALDGSNHKSQLQQLAQRRFGATPTYALLDEKGPDHSKCFKMAARIGMESFPPAWGPTKKDAEQRAAFNALSHLAGEPVPFEAD